MVHAAPRAARLPQKGLLAVLLPRDGGTCVEDCPIKLQDRAGSNTLGVSFSFGTSYEPELEVFAQCVKASVCLDLILTWYHCAKSRLGCILMHTISNRVFFGTPLYCGTNERRTLIWLACSRNWNYKLCPTVLRPVADTYWPWVKLWYEQ